MFDYKNIFASKTVWGGIIAVAGGILGLFGYEIGGVDKGALVEHGAAIATSVGGAVAIWGRVKASKLIGK